MIRYGIAGFGHHAVRRLMPGFALAKNSRAVALSRRDQKKAAEAAAHYGIAHVFSSTEELCRCPEVDAIFVASPDALHKADVLTAIRHRKPVLCEKPLAMNAAECQEMVEAARQANVLFGVAHIFRFEESTARLRERIASGDVGTPLLARSEFCYLGTAHPRTWITDPTLAAGGPIADVGVHCIDTLRYILQDEVETVHATARRDEKSGPVEAVGVLTLKFVRGTLATVLVSTRAQYRSPVEVIGSAGTLRADDGLTVDRPVNIELWQEQKLVASDTVSNEDAYARQVDSFADDVEHKHPFPAPGEVGWQNQVILDAAYRSATSGRTEGVEVLKK